MKRLKSFFQQYGIARGFRYSFIVSIRKAWRRSHPKAIERFTARLAAQLDNV